MLELFACRSDVELTASSQYAAIDHPEKDQSPVRLEHSNIGGHYVVTSTAKSYEFFVKVKGQTANPFYKIQYSYIDNYSKMIPYKHFETADRTLTYQLTNDAIVIEYQTPLPKDGLLPTPKTSTPTRHVTSIQSLPSKYLRTSG